MTEGKLKNDLLRFFQSRLRGYRVSSENLPYRAVVGADGKPSFSYVRGEGAYQVDVLISLPAEPQPVPLVAVEVKGGKSSTTHDAIVYSDKARAHKAVYPHLRYGFVSRDTKVEGRTILHSDGFDFIVALGQGKEPNRWKQLLVIVRGEIQTARNIREALEAGDGSPTEGGWVFPPSLSTVK